MVRTTGSTAGRYFFSKPEEDETEIFCPSQPEQRHQPEISEDENRSWIVAPSDRLVFKAKADAAGEMETTMTVSNRCQKTTTEAFRALL